MEEEKEGGEWRRKKKGNGEGERRRGMEKTNGAGK